MNKIEVSRVIAAPAEKVFAELSNHEGYARFGGVDKAELLRDGEFERNGLGAVRRLKLGAITVDEEVLTFDAPTLMEYRITRMRPMLFKHLLGRVELKEAGGKTTVRWTSEYDVPLPVVGSTVEKLLEKPLASGFVGMLKAVERLVT